MIEYALYFIVYSFFGWFVESVFRSVVEKGKLVNSGFLAGPFIPVYGFGSLIFIAVGNAVSSFPFAGQLLLFTLFATILEYITSVLLEKIFKLKLWDYNNYPIGDTYHIRFPLNINGRICLLFSLFWALLISFQIFYLQPFFTGVISHIPFHYRYLILFFFLVYVSVDLYFTTRLYYRFSRFLGSIKQMQFDRITNELHSRLRIIASTRAMHTFLRPLKAFPYLREQLSTAWKKIPLGTEMPFLQDIRTIIADKLPLLKSKKRTKNLNEFFSLGNSILNNPEYQKLKGIKHHDKDIYTHNVSVAWISFLIAKKFHLHVDEVVRGALLHDFFFYDWHTFRDRDYFLPHGFSHPRISYKNAVRIFGRLTPREKDIIVKHMWPLTVIPPLYRESFLVSMVDKTIASKEALKAVFPKNKVEK